MGGRRGQLEEDWVDENVGLDAGVGPFSPAYHALSALAPPAASAKRIDEGGASGVGPAGRAARATAPSSSWPNRSMFPLPSTSGCSFSAAALVFCRRPAGTLSSSSTCAFAMRISKSVSSSPWRFRGRRVEARAETTGTAGVASVDCWLVARSAAAHLACSAESSLSPRASPLSWAARRDDSAARCWRSSSASRARASASSRRTRATLSAL